MAMTVLKIFRAIVLVVLMDRVVCLNATGSRICPSESFQLSDDPYLVFTQEILDNNTVIVEMIYEGQA